MDPDTNKIVLLFNPRRIRGRGTSPAMDCAFAALPLRVARRVVLEFNSRALKLRRVCESWPFLKVTSAKRCKRLAGRADRWRDGENFGQKPCPPDHLLKIIRTCSTAEY